MPRERFLSRPRPALALACALLVLMVVAALVVPDGPLGVDERWSQWMRDAWASGPVHAARFLAWAGRGVGRALTLVLLALPLVLRRRWLGLGAFAAVEALTPLGTTALKALAGRPRPPDQLVHAAGSAFPSGHASYAAATLVALVLLYTRPGPRRPLWWALAALGTAAMAWSRTYLHVHWLSDVAAGAAWGWALALAVFAAAQLLAGHRS